MCKILYNVVVGFKKAKQDRYSIIFLRYSQSRFCLFIDMMKLQRAKEQNDRLDAENRALRERVRTIESEKKNLSDQVGNLLI